MLFYYGDQKIHVKYVYDDTLFTLNDNQLSPYLITQYESPQMDTPNMVNKVGDRRSSYERLGNSSFIIFHNHTFKGYMTFNTWAKADYERVYFLLNKSNGNSGVIKSYTDDFIGKVQTNEIEIMTLPSYMPNNKLYVLYYPNEIMKGTSSYQVSTEYPKSFVTQLNKIKENLSETNNPVILI